MNALVRTVELHLAVPFAISRATHTTKRVVLVELREGDRVARGEGVPDAFFGETPESVERDIRTGLELLPEDPGDLGLLDRRLSIQFPRGGAACCAIDVLAHDRAAQAAGLPLREYLGLAPASAPPTSFTIGIAEPEVMAERAAGAAAAGFEVLKVKLGHGDDVRVLSAIRERFTGTIRVDPNAAWSAREAPGRIAALVRFGIEFVEQPIPPDDLEGLRAVHERSELPIVVDEAVVTVRPSISRASAATTTRSGIPTAWVSGSPAASRGSMKTAGRGGSRTSRIRSSPTSSSSTPRWASSFTSTTRWAST